MENAVINHQQKTTRKTIEDEDMLEASIISYTFCIANVEYY